MPDEQLVDRRDLEATIRARAEVGQELEPELIDAFVERLERRIAERPRQGKPIDEEDARGMSFVIALVSLGTGIPITAIAASAEGLAGIAVAWAGIAAVNFLARR